jgi:hypothetical protein
MLRKISYHLLLLITIVTISSCKIPLTEESQSYINFDYQQFDLKLSYTKSNLCNSILDSMSWWHYEAIDNILITLDSINTNDTIANENEVVSCLTNELEKSKWATLNLDTLSFLLSVSEHFQSYAEANPRRKYVFRPVSIALCNHVSNSLTKLNNVNSSIKYTDKFDYVYRHSIMLNCSPSIRYTNSEKAFIYFTQKKWGYLFIDRYWNGTSVLFKFFTGFTFISFFAMFLYGSYNLYKKINLT